MEGLIADLVVHVGMAEAVPAKGYSVPAFDMDLRQFRVRVVKGGVRPPKQGVVQLGLPALGGLYEWGGATVWM